MFRLATITTLLLTLFAAAAAAAGTIFTDVEVDVSSSMMRDGDVKGSPANRTLEALTAEVRRLRKGDTLVVYCFAKGTPVRVLKVTMPSVAGPREVNLTTTREAAIRKLVEGIKNSASRIDPSGTDLLGALRMAERVFSESAAKNRRLVLFSDMVDNQSLGLGLGRLASHGGKFFLAKAEQSGFPKLQQVNVEIHADFADEKGVSGANRERGISELKMFWQQWFERTGARIVSFRTIN